MALAWLNKDGKWLTYRETRTHTGTHKSIGTTPDINLAYVGLFPTYNENPEGLKVLELIPVHAQVVTTRTVTLSLPPVEMERLVPNENAK